MHSAVNMPIAIAGNEKIDMNMRNVDYIVNKTYLAKLDDSGKSKPIPFLSLAGKVGTRKSSSCFFPVKKIVYDQEENNLQKLVNVYSSAYVANINIAMIIKSAVDGIEIYLGVCDEPGEREEGAQPKAEVLYNSFIGNFPGSRSSFDDDIAVLDLDDTKKMMQRCFPDNYTEIAGISAVASLRSPKVGESRNENFFQGIEKVIEAMNGRDYTLLVLAKALKNDELNGIREELESLYAALSPFAKNSISISQGNSNSITNSLANSTTKSLTNSNSNSLNIGISRSSSEGENKHSNHNAGISFPLINIMNAGASKGKGSYKSKSESGNLNKGASITMSETDGNTITLSNGSSVTYTSGQSLQLSYENKEIVDILSAIDLQLKRLKTGAGLGMYATAAYVLAPTNLDVKLCASSYKASISGDNTYVEQASINIWQGEIAKEVRSYLKHFQHPVFSLNDFITDSSAALPTPKLAKTTPATIVSVPELALHMSLPKKSVNKIPVCNGVTFGRNVILLNGGGSSHHGLILGNIYHLGIKEDTKAYLDLDSLTMHTFITGTTGSGKSNTIYGILDSIKKKRKAVNFLVVEPAKGEYKTVFGNRKDVSVYGTNPKMAPLLRINPFRFREDVHILEHLDKLVSIFNVCWPMEAAMPSILKQGIERAYTLVGWDLRNSTNKYSESLFPDFNDVMQEVESILNESQYSDENRGNYIGALCTRLKELTTGLNSMLFVPDDLTDEELFEKNVIVDLSRVGSMETKSLLMGLIVIRLQEYRQATQVSLKTPLTHITVLEEAHHLLKRTSTDQSMNSANLAGKSVEMLTNAFAEMRSAGEGFIIADQAPGMMDMSVIRNTNTKIIMRLPAHEDRELVGRAIGLNDLQISELARLPTGVAATYQNDWLSPVLVQMPYHKVVESFYRYNEDNVYIATDGDEELLLEAIMRKDGVDRLLNELGGGVEAVSCLRLSNKVKLCLLDYMEHKEIPQYDRLGKLSFELFNMREVVKKASRDSFKSWKEDVLRELRPSLNNYSMEEQETLLLILGHEYSRQVKEFRPIYMNLIENIK